VVVVLLSRFKVALHLFLEPEMALGLALATNYFTNGR